MQWSLYFQERYSLAQFSNAILNAVDFKSGQRQAFRLVSLVEIYIQFSQFCKCTTHVRYFVAHVMMKTGCIVLIVRLVETHTS